MVRAVTCKKGRASLKSSWLQFYIFNRTATMIHLKYDVDPLVHKMYLWYVMGGGPKHEKNDANIRPKICQ